MNVTHRQVWIAMAIVAAAVAALLLNRIALTDKQRVERVLRKMAAAAEDGDVSGIFSRISADFENETMTREDLRMMAVGFFLTNRHVRVSIKRMTVTVSGTMARVEVTISGQAGDSGNQWGTGTMDWWGTLRKEADGAWRVTDIAPVRMDGGDFPGWRKMSRELR